MGPFWFSWWQDDSAWQPKTTYKCTTVRRNGIGGGKSLDSVERVFVVVVGLAIEEMESVCARSYSHKQFSTSAFRRRPENELIS